MRLVKDRVYIEIRDQVRRQVRGVRFSNDSNNNKVYWRVLSDIGSATQRQVWGQVWTRTFQQTREDIQK